MTLREGQGLTGRAVMEDRVVSMDIASYPNESLRQDFQQKGCTDLLSVPLKTGDGIIGAITMAYSNRTNAKNQKSGQGLFLLSGRTDCSCDAECPGCMNSSPEWPVLIR